MRNTIRKLLNQPKQQPIGPHHRADLVELLQHHGKTIVPDGRRFQLQDGDPTNIAWNGMLETDVAPIIATLVKFLPEKVRQEYAAAKTRP